MSHFPQSCKTFHRHFSKSGYDLGPHNARKCGALVLFAAYVEDLGRFFPNLDVRFVLQDPYVLVGLFVGGLLPYLFGAMGQLKGLSAKTVRNILQILSSALKLVQEQRIILTNPAECCVSPKIEHRAMKALPVEQLPSFLREAMENGVQAATK